jgi:hypothetical protein
LEAEGEAQAVAIRAKANAEAITVVGQGSKRECFFNIYALSLIWLLPHDNTCSYLLFSKYQPTHIKTHTTHYHFQLSLGLVELKQQIWLSPKNM